MPKKEKELSDLEKQELLNQMDIETDLSLVSSEQKLILKMPIKIRLNLENDGYVIIDANKVEHFFYKNKTNGLLDYDGWCIPVNK